MVKRIRAKTVKSQKTNYQSSKTGRKKKPKKQQELHLLDLLVLDKEPITIIAIDPGSHRLGWSVSEIYLNKQNNNIDRVWRDRGTIYGRYTHGKNLESILDQIDSIVTKYKVTNIILEDYIFIPGKSAGTFVVPGLIGAIKYYWYGTTGLEPIMVEPGTWKKIICNNMRADKIMIMESLDKLLDKTIIDNIVDEFSKHKLKKDQDPQDCFDAIAIDLFVQLHLNNEIKEREAKVDEII